MSCRRVWRKIAPWFPRRYLPVGEEPYPLKAENFLIPLRIRSARLIREYFFITMKPFAKTLAAWPQPMTTKNNNTKIASPTVAVTAGEAEMHLLSKFHNHTRGETGKIISFRLSIHQGTFFQASDHGDTKIAAGCHRPAARQACRDGVYAAAYRQSRQCLVNAYPLMILSQVPPPSPPLWRRLPPKGVAGLRGCGEQP